MWCMFEAGESRICDKWAQSHTKGVQKVRSLRYLSDDDKQPLVWDWHPHPGGGFGIEEKVGYMCRVYILYIISSRDEPLAAIAGASAEAPSAPNRV